jgi:hypothetical protein
MINLEKKELEMVLVEPLDLEIYLTYLVWAEVDNKKVVLKKENQYYIQLKFH